MFYSNFLPSLRPALVMSPVVVSLRFPLFPPNSPFVLFRPENGLFRLPKHYVLKEKLTNFEVKNTLKLGKKSQKDKWFHFHA